jgi:hypothetical protein
MNNDELIVTILDDGTVRAESPGAISPANHGSAEAVLSMIAQSLGGETKVERTQKHHQHTHTHEHDRAKQEG